MKENLTKKIIRIAVVAALYAVLTLALSWISFNSIQFRVAEILIILCFFRKDYVYSLVIGCAIANCFSPMGVYDITFGTIATLLSALSVAFIKRIEIGLSLTVIFNALIVGAELYYVLESPFWFSCGFVAIGEFVVLVVGYFVYLGLRKNEWFLNLIGSEKTVKKNGSSRTIFYLNIVAKN